MGCKSKNGFKPKKIKVKPIPWPEREKIELTIGGTYYISFGGGIVHECELTGIKDESNMVEVTRGDRVNYLYQDEIGRTPEEAVRHEVTF